MLKQEFSKFEVYEQYTLVKNINIYRMFNDLTKTQFAFYCDLSASTVDLLGRKRPSDNVYKKLSKFTGVPIRVLKKLAITEDELVSNKM